MENKPKFVGQHEDGVEYEVDYPEALYMEPFTPMIDRLEKEKPELLDGFHKILKEVGPEEFQKYFNQFTQINKVDHRMIITTKSLMHKVVIEKLYLPLIMEAFQVTNLRIIAQE